MDKSECAANFHFTSVSVCTDNHFANPFKPIFFTMMSSKSSFCSSSFLNESPFLRVHASDLDLCLFAQLDVLVIITGLFLNESYHSNETKAFSRKLSSFIHCNSDVIEVVVGLEVIPVQHSFCQSYHSFATVHEGSVSFVESVPVVNIHSSNLDDSSSSF